mmetsp:Transcript_143796/g.460315  ORF Transcript_143796/g.460315 Transcript_143796/m.460315 type:complete len:517 (+) Transcript_143796:68-1618(+)
MVSVCLNNVAGETLRLEMDARCTVSDVKRAVSDQWGTPAECQKLVFGCSLLEDDRAVVLDYCQGEGSVELTMVVDISHELHGKRLAAVRALARSCRAGDDRIVAYLMQHADDVALNVRCAVMESVCSLAEPDDQRVISMLITRCADQRPDARSMAIRFLAKFAVEDHSSAVHALLRCIQDPLPNVRRAAIEAISPMARHDAEAIVPCVAERQTDSNEHVRSAAAAGLFKMAEEGDQSVVSVLRHVAQTASAMVRIGVVAALSRIPDQDGERHAERVTALLADPEAGVRCEALRSVCSSKGAWPACVLTEVLRSLCDVDLGVRRAAVEAIAALPQGSSGQHRATLALCANLEHPSADVRATALEALRKLPWLEAQAVEALCGRLPRLGPSERCGVVGTLGDRAARGDGRAIAAVGPCLQDEDMRVRRAAVLALAKMAPPGDEGAIYSLAACLEDEEARVRCAVEVALREVAQCGNECAIAAVSARLQHPKDFVRRAAASALTIVADRDRVRSIVQAL